MSPFDEPEVCRTILEDLPAGLCVVDTQKRIVFWSNGAERITGHLRHEVIGHSCVGETILHCDQPGCEFCREDCVLARSMKMSHGVEGSGVMHHKAGYEIPVRVRAVPVRDDHGWIIGAAEVFEELQQASSPDRGQTNHLVSDCRDGVTGLASRAMMQSHLQKALTDFQKQGVFFGVLRLRVEGLAPFRSRLGPEAAISFLRVVARTLEKAICMTDFVGRWSEDEFLVILNGAGKEALSASCERLRHTLAGQGIEWWGERRCLPVSIAQTAIEAEDTIESLLARLGRMPWRSPAALQKSEPPAGS
jgi:diguanylate cyclase (GGDEF)-like protein/PAS domain S-box-containing protein